MSKSPCPLPFGTPAVSSPAIEICRAQLGVLAIDSLAAANGVQDLDRFAACVEQGRGSAVIDRDAALAQVIGSTGTPAVIIDGEWYPGGGPRLEQLRAMIKEAAQ